MAPSSPTASPSTRRQNPRTDPRATTPLTGSARRAPSPTAPPNPSGRRPTAWSNASTDASASIWVGCRKTAPPTTAAFSTMPTDTYLHTFVTDYNRTRLRCLDYQAPAELLAKLAGHNTFA